MSSAPLPLDSVRWLDPKAAAAAAEVRVDLLYKWHERRQMVVDYLPGGTYRVAVKPSGLPVRPDTDLGRALLALTGGLPSRPTRRRARARRRSRGRITTRP